MKYVILISCLALLNSCSLVQDVDYARLQYDTGLEEQAEQTLKELSDDGYVEGQLALADMYCKSDKIAKLLLAGRYYKQYRSTSDQVEYKYLQWLITMSELDSSYCEPAYQALWQRQKQSHDALPLLVRFYSSHKDLYSSQELDPVLQALLVETDSTSSRETVLKVLDTIDHPEKYSSYISSYCNHGADSDNRSICLHLRLKTAKIANNADQIEQVIKQIQQEYLPADKKSAERLSIEGEKTVYQCANLLLQDKYGPKHIAAGLRLAAIGADQSSRLFLLCARHEYQRRIVFSDQVLLTGLHRLEKQGNKEAIRILGRMYARGWRVIDDPAKAVYYLNNLTDDPKAMLYLGRLFLSGKLGAEKLQDGVDKLLFAARNGEYRAYYELSEAFYSWPGIKRNSTYSWVFANMAKETMDALAVDKNINSLIDTLTGEIRDSVNAENMLRHEQSQLRASLQKTGLSISLNSH